MSEHQTESDISAFGVRNDICLSYGADFWLPLFSYY